MRTQVTEYIPDVDRARSEAFRVVRRRGRGLFLAITAIAALSIVGSVFAHIGETLEQSIKRYGPVQDTEKDDQCGLPVYQFTKGEYHIAIVVGESGKTVKITYRHKSSSLGLIAELSNVEITKFLNAEKSGPWIGSRKVDDSGAAWVNGGFNAEYTARNSTLSIAAPDYSKLVKERMNGQKRKSD